MSLDDLVQQLQQVHGSALTAVVLYGSAVSGERVAHQSDTNVLVLAQSLPLKTLSALTQTMRAWREAGNPPVVSITTAEWNGSADIFPMEYADILERHRVLFGVLPLDGITVNQADLRLQVEREAMGTLLRLRRAVMVAGNDTTQQAGLLKNSVSTLLTLFRAVLRLHGEAASGDTHHIIDAVSRHCGFDGAPYRHAISLRHGEPMKEKDAGQMLDSYVAGLDSLVRHLDALEGR